MDRQPPPFFNRGPAPLVQLFFYAALSMALLFLDLRFHTLDLLRQGLSLFAHPLQKVAQAPVNLFRKTTHFLVNVKKLQEENSHLHKELLKNTEALLRMQQLEIENERLRRLLNVTVRPKMNGQVAQILYAARDPFSRRVVIDKGVQNNIVLGNPAIDDAGVVGQVTRVFPFVSEVTLITDKNQAVPVEIVRNGMRSVVFGLGNGQLELRFMASNADVQEGDMLVTSGLDGVFLQGLPVARVIKVERDASHTFAQIYCAPIAGVESFGELIVLDPQQMVELPEELSEPKAEKSTKKPGRKRRP